MTHEEFDKLVQKVELGHGRNAASLKRRVFWLALLGYAGLAAPLAIVVVISLALIVPGILWPKDAAVCIVFGAVLLVLGGWAAGRVLWIRLPPPEGRVLTSAEAPNLFSALDELRARLNCTEFHQVLVTADFNAAVSYRPRLGVFGWNRSYLRLGLPLMEGLSRDEVVAVLAHECAHLSRQHHRATAWVYRLRSSWHQIFESFAKPRVHGEFSLRPLTRKFIDWFWPRFNAHAFVLSRTHEYQADASAAEVAGTRHAGSALVRLAWYGNVLDDKFWPALWQLSASQPEPPPGIFLRLSQFFPSINCATNARQLEQAFSTATTNSDTHPCLVERLRAIHSDIAVPAGGRDFALPPATPNAAEALLGTSLRTIRDDVERNWRKVCEPNWRQQHSKSGVLQDRLAKIDHSTGANQADVDALWDKAHALLAMQHPDSAMPLLRRILEVDPAHVAANFNLGLLLLKSGDPNGELHLEQAIAEDEELLPPAAGPLHAFYQRTGQSARIRELYVRMDTFEKSIAASKLERNHVTAADTFVPHDLSDAELSALCQVLAQEPELLTAHLGRKELKYFTRQKLYLLCIRLKPRWHRLPSADRDQAAVNRLVTTVHLPGRFLVFTNSGMFRGVARKLRALPGTQIFWRT